MTNSRDAHVSNWALTVEGRNLDGAPFGQEILADVTGTREQAMTALWEHMQGFQPPRPMFVRRWWAYRDADGYLARYEGSSGGHHLYVFLLRPLVWTSPQPPAAS